MKEGSPVSDHLDEFNRTILDLKNTDCKLNDEDQTLIFSCPLHLSFEHFIDSCCMDLARILSLLRMLKILRTLWS
jgi:hypothetical protein